MTRTPDLFRTWIVPLSVVDACRAIAAGFGPGGVGMWVVGLSPTGEAPATHFVSSGFVPAEFAGLSPFKEYSRDREGALIEANSYAGDAKTVSDFATKAGLKLNEAQVKAIFAASDVSTQPVFEAMDRMGLKLVRAPDALGVATKGKT